MEYDKEDLKSKDYRHYLISAGVYDLWENNDAQKHGEYMRRPLKKEAFEKIKDLKIPINTVLDIGVNTGTPELMLCFKDKKHFLVEPIVEFNDSINEAYGECKINFTLVNFAASNFNGVAKIKASTISPNKQITHARFTDESLGKDIREINVRTADSLVEEYLVEKPYLLKIDVDGAELLVLEGSKKILKNTNVLVVEANIKNFIERSVAIANEGFELFDIVDPCYYDDRLRQFDMIFLNSNIISELDIDMYKQKFDISKWKTYR
jgi:FkbM family methyltransferase